MKALRRFFERDLSSLASLRRQYYADELAAISPKGEARKKLERAGYRVVVYPPSITMAKDWQGTALAFGDLAVATASGDDEEGMYEALLLAVKG